MACLRARFRRDRRLAGSRQPRPVGQLLRLERQGGQILRAPPFPCARWGRDISRVQRACLSRV